VVSLTPRLLLLPGEIPPLAIAGGLAGHVDGMAVDRVEWSVSRLGCFYSRGKFHR
jgi:hypothetical protein